MLEIGASSLAANQPVPGGTQGTDQPVATPAKHYSIASAATALRRSESWVKEKKQVLLRAFSKDRSLVVSKNGSLTEFGLQQLELMKGFAATGETEKYVEWAWSQYPELRPAPQLPTAQPLTVDAEVIDDGNGNGNGTVAPSISAEIVLYQPAPIVRRSEEVQEEAALAMKQAGQILDLNLESALGNIDEFCANLTATTAAKVSGAIQAGVAQGLNQAGSSVGKHASATKVNVKDQSAIDGGLQNG